MSGEKSLGNRLRTLRKLRSISQTELANQMRVSRSTIAMWETDRRVPDLLMVQRLADFFQMTVDDFLDCKREAEGYDPLTESFVSEFRDAPAEQQKELIRIWYIIRERK
ncbi:helix-turn-helix transcriptional regulator [Numidum massiliense]|uniref:helix-turn-helix transcriptional regulator n=1 Tax=Numidum massiliense TaxID=1522315 RepID=UPI0006D549B2|nr:helix-turn-helix transcriptional regulator [Numidum massiliense]